MRRGFLSDGLSKQALSWNPHINPKDVNIIKNNAFPIDKTTIGKDSSQLNPILEAIGNSKIIMIGEATHGTQEFYHIRAEITKQLILQNKIKFVIVEADWPSAYALNNYIKAQKEFADPKVPLSRAFNAFDRFPLWMWRNEVVRDFIEWLRVYNSSQSPYDQVSFYGMDIYSLTTSINQVIQTLNRIDPEMADLAVKRYSKLLAFKKSEHDYARYIRLGRISSAQKDVTQMTTDLSAKVPQYLSSIPEDDIHAKEDILDLIQNANLIQDAENYYRNSFSGSVSTWNIRDTAMLKKIDISREFWRMILSKNNNKRPTAHQDKRRKIDDEVNPIKCVVWAHNSHLGDARSTEFGWIRGELNVGQLVKEKYGEKDAFNIGFSTYNGTVTAAREWDGPAETRKLRNGFPDSYEAFFSDVSAKMGGDFGIIIRRNDDSGKQVSEDVKRVLKQKKVQRAVGVVYVKPTERQSHYFEVRLVNQFDVMIHIDTSSALIPLPVGGTKPAGSL